MIKLGAFEELVLLAINALDDQAYGVSIKDLLQERTGKTPSIGALHSALYRLEGKGFLKSWTGGATSERGGRRKKYYILTNLGTKALEEAHQLRLNVRTKGPGLNLGLHE